MHFVVIGAWPAAAVAAAAAAAVESRSRTGDRLPEGKSESQDSQEPVSVTDGGVGGGRA